MDEIKHDDVLNLEGVPCPQNSARALLKLEGMDSGEVLKIIVDDGEPIQNVPPAIEDEGFVILERTKLEDNRWSLSVKVP